MPHNMMILYFRNIYHLPQALYYDLRRRVIFRKPLSQWSKYETFELLCGNDQRIPFGIDVVLGTLKIYWYATVVFMGLLPDKFCCGLRMRRECRE